MLESVHSHKHLGVPISSNLTWTSHIDCILISVPAMCNVMKKLKYDVDRHSLERTYVSFIRPKLAYASHIWQNCSKQDSDKL